MTQSDLIAELAARADDLLAGVTDRTLARTRLLEELSLEYRDLTSTERAEITEGVIATLEADEFFGWEFCGNPFAEEPEPVEPDDF